MAVPIDILLTMEEYFGIFEAFKAESVTRVRAAMEVSEKEAQQMLEDLIHRDIIKAEITPRGGEIRGEYPKARWKWVRIRA